MGRSRLFSIAIVGLASLPLLALAHGISAEERQRMLDGGYFEYVLLGARHMLTGYDHLLFLFGVVFFLTSLRDIVKFVTAFTLGHCITLIFATFYGITWNYYLIDALIAVSVIYKGFDNVDGFRKYLDMKSPNLLWVVFGFGLLHGFGLSTRLQQLPLGDDKTSILLRILSFNLGVEAGADRRACRDGCGALPLAQTHVVQAIQRYRQRRIDLRRDAVAVDATPQPPSRSRSRWIPLSRQ